MKIRVYDILWDTDGIDVDNLPKEVIINKPTEEILEDVDGYSEKIENYLSDTYGWCTFGFQTELITETDCTKE